MLTAKETVVVFTYAPAGLGHLRVTDALYEGLPKGVTPLLLGSQDQMIKKIHRLTSIHPVLRRVMEWTQWGRPEDVLTYWYRKTLRMKNDRLYHQVLTLLDQRLDTPKTLLVISTHFGLAHQLSEVKERLWQERKVKMILILQVTDDSPQHIWFVPGADLVFVPSETTRGELIKYGKQVGFSPLKFEVVSYPVSPKLGRKLSKESYTRRIHQAETDNSSQIHVSIPLSGAAVGMTFFEHMINGLHDMSHRFVFHIVGRQSVNTYPFLGKMTGRDEVVIDASGNDREVVDRYQEVFEEQPISLEVTKPSEQAFKALYSTRQAGGCVLLFAEPVGRQEYDNLDFLERHNLMPSPGESKYMWTLASRSKGLVGKQGEAILKEAEYWRGLRLPKGSYASVEFVWWCLQEGVIAAMMKCRALPRKYDEHKHELSPDGVKIFWDRVEEFLDLTKSGALRKKKAG